MRALSSTPQESVVWLTDRLDAFGNRLGAVLYRIPGTIRRRTDGTSDGAIRQLLSAWPRSLPLVLEFVDPSWHVDETFAAMRDAGAVLCTTELPETDGPLDIRVTGTGLYLRLRRLDYSTGELAAWADRLKPFLDAGHPVFVVFRHDESGRATDLAAELMSLAG